MSGIKVKNLLLKFRKRFDDILVYFIIVGVLLLSIGVYVMGSEINRSLGRNLIILGSGIFYLSVIIFTFRL